MRLETRHFPPREKTVFLTGSGSVRLTAAGMEHYKTISDSSWAPFLNAVRRWASDLEIEGSATWLKDSDSLRLSYACRYTEAKAALDCAISLLHSGDEVDKQMMELASCISQLREMIAAEFKLCDEKKYIETRTELLHSLQNLAPYMRADAFPFGVVSTNWDKAWLNSSDLRLHGVVHTFPYFNLHGSFDSPSKVYLPMDTSWEDSPRHLLLACTEAEKKHANKELFTCQKQRISQSLREQKAIKEMIGERISLKKTLDESTTLVIWGLSFAPEDSELSSLVSSAARTFQARGSWPKTIIADPDPATRNKVAALLNLPRSCRFDLDPLRPEYLEIYDMRNL